VFGGPQTRYETSEEKSLASEGIRERFARSPTVGLFAILSNQTQVLHYQWTQKVPFGRLLVKELGGPQTQYEPSEEKSLASDEIRERIPRSPTLDLLTILSNQSQVLHYQWTQKVPFGSLLVKELDGPQTKYEPSEEKSLACEGIRERIPCSPNLDLLTIPSNQSQVLHYQWTQKASFDTTP